MLLLYGQSISLDSYAVHATLLRAIRPAPWPNVAALLKGVASVCKKIVVKVNDWLKIHMYSQERIRMGGLCKSV